MTDDPTHSPEPTDSTGPRLVTAPQPDPSETDTRLRLVAIALAVALLAALVGLGLMWRALDQEKDEDREAKAALQEAKQAAGNAAVAMGSYDYRSLDQDFAWLEEDVTDKLRLTFAGEDGDIDQYLADLKEYLTRVKGHADAQVARSVGELDGDDEATVLLFVDQLLSNGQEEPSQALTRVEMTMVERDGEWLVDGLLLHNPDTITPSLQP